MKNIAAAAVAACMAMLATSGIVAFATAAPSRTNAQLASAEAELQATLDHAIAAQLARVKANLSTRAINP